VIAVLVTLSIILTASVLYPDVTGRQILFVLAGGISLAVVAFAVTLLLQRRQNGAAAGHPEIRWTARARAAWRMPKLSTLSPLHLTLSKRVWMIVLRGYLILAVGMVLVRVVQLALGQG
jgi:hypothetical protein